MLLPLLPPAPDKPVPGRPHVPGSDPQHFHLAEAVAGQQVQRHPFLVRLRRGVQGRQLLPTQGFDWVLADNGGR